MKIVADAHIPYIKGLLEPYAQVTYKAGRDIRPSDVAEADALLVRTRTRCDAALLEGSPVKFIGTATIGTDHIDLAYCAGQGIEVVSAPGSNARGVLQWVAAALEHLSLSQGWEPSGKTLGIVGVGHVGSLVREFARAWGFSILCSDPPREKAERLGTREGFAPLPEIASRADIITFHTPLTGEGPYPTLGLAGRQFFDAVKAGAVIMNSARGGIVDEKLLKEAIREKSCTACIDTWSNEPDIDRELLSLAAIATPHIAGYTMQGKTNAAVTIISALARRFGLPVSFSPSSGRPGRPISWDDLRETIGLVYDIGAETSALKQDPGRFESMRENYSFRNEYF